MKLPDSVVMKAFHLLYYQASILYNPISWMVSIGHWATWRRAVIPYIKDGLVLEVGVGTGDLLMELALKGYKIYGIDRSQYMLSIANKKKRRLKSSDYSHLFLADVSALPFMDGTFQTVIATFPTEHIFQSVALKQIGRILRSRGNLAIVWGAMMRAPHWLQGFILWLYAFTGQKQSVSVAMADQMRAFGLESRIASATGKFGKVELVISDKI